MYKLTLKFIINGIALGYLWLIFILPSQWYKIGQFGEIFPAFDIIIIYYISTYNSLKDWQLLLIGLFVDQLYMLPIGTSPLAFILGNLSINYLSKWFLLKNSFTNLLVFYGYSAFILMIRYLIVSIKSNYPIEGYGIIFHYLTTIFSYPLLSIIISIALLDRNAR